MISMAISKGLGKSQNQLWREERRREIIAKYKAVESV